MLQTDARTVLVNLSELSCCSAWWLWQLECYTASLTSKGWGRARPLTAIIENHPSRQCSLLHSNRPSRFYSVLEVRVYRNYILGNDFRLEQHSVVWSTKSFTCICMCTLCLLVTLHTAAASEQAKESVSSILSHSKSQSVRKQHPIKHYSTSSASEEWRGRDFAMKCIICISWADCVPTLSKKHASALRDINTANACAHAFEHWKQLYYMLRRSVLMQKWLICDVKHTKKANAYKKIPLICPAVYHQEESAVVCAHKCLLIDLN